MSDELIILPVGNGLYVLAIKHPELDAPLISQDRDGMQRALDKYNRRREALLSAAGVDNEEAPRHTSVVAVPDSG